MSTLWPSALASLDDSSALLGESLQKLKAAESVDTADVIEQFKTAAESARNLRALVLSELPEASWQSREELDALLQKIQKRAEERTLENIAPGCWLWRLSWRAAVSCTVGPSV